MYPDDTETWLASHPDPDLTDPDNPEWTEEDFARAVGPEQMSAVELAAFPNTLKRLGRPPSPERKAEVKLRLDRDVLSAWRASGPGWQTRMNEALRRAMPQPADAAAG